MLRRRRTLMNKNSVCTLANVLAFANIQGSPKGYIPRGATAPAVISYTSNTVLRFQQCIAVVHMEREAKKEPFFDIQFFRIAEYIIR